MLIWLKGVVLGFSIAAPVGPIGLLCIRRTLAEGRMSGFISGLGAASADAVYGSIAALGLTAVMACLSGIQSWVHLLGGGFLIWLGIQTWLKPAVNESVRPINRINLGQTYVSTLVLTLSNPMTILSFLAIFAGTGFTSTTSDLSSAVGLVSGVFCGSILWWLLLSQSVGWLRQRLGNTLLVWINRAAGIGLVLFGLTTMGSELALLLGKLSWPPAF